MPHVDALSAERHALRAQQCPLPFTFGKRPVGAHDPVPGERRVVVVVKDRAGEAGGPGRDIAVGPHESDRSRPNPLEDRLLTRRHLRQDTCEGAA